MPLAVYILGLAIFAQGTSEFMLSGLLDPIAADLGVSIPDAGLLTSAYAIGMVVGGLPLAVLTLSWPRRRALQAFLAVFAVAHVAGAVTSDYGVLLTSRVISAVANAGFWAVAAATALSLVPPHVKGRAMSIVVGGITLACVAGVPGGAVLGQHWGWRSAFWAVALVSALAMICIQAIIPAGRDTGARPGVRQEVRAMLHPPLWNAYATIALAEGAMFCVFTYLGVLLTRVTGLSEGWVPAMLVLFGVGSMIGITLGGRVADAYPFQLLFGGLIGLVGACVAFGLFAGSAPVAIGLVFLLGLLGFGINPALSARGFSLAAGAPVLAGATVTAAFNIGNTVGPWLGGVTIDAGLGYRSVAWVGAALGVAALGTVVVAVVLHRRAAPSPNDAPLPEAAVTS